MADEIKPIELTAEKKIILDDDVIQPTTKEGVMLLEDKDYLLIKAIRELTQSIKTLTTRIA